MTDRLARELVEQAEDLLHGGERGRPTEADLRRAVSGAYYALFHELTLLVAERLTARLGDEVRADVRRHFAHGPLNKVCTWVGNGGTPPKAPALAALVTVVRTSEILPSVAEAFTSLQERRHEADYDHRAVVTKETSRLALDLARDAIELLDEAARGADEVQIDALVALLALAGGGTR